MDRRLRWYLLALAAYTLPAFCYLRTGCYALGYFDVELSFGLITWSSTGEPLGDPRTTISVPSPVWLLLTFAAIEGWLAIRRRIERGS